jgi:hypothetical protein
LLRRGNRPRRYDRCRCRCRVRSVQSPVGSSADFLADLSGASDGARRMLDG